VKVDINTRGICCLKPGVPGVSENVRVVSIVGRFLEHSRIYSFERDGEQCVYIGSADLMPRNLDTRVELLTPIREDSHRADLIDTLDRCFADNVNAWELDNQGSWTRRTRADGEPRSVQRELMAAHAAAAAEASSTKPRD
jgi:polyphosphate kinase